MSSAGIFGGTFDPVHFGHLITAQRVKEIRKLDKLIFIPAFISPFKQDENISEGKHRLKMLQIAIEGVKGFEVSDIELNNKNVSYTVTTLEKLKNKFSHSELIIGFDNIIDFNKWKKPDRILELSKLIVMKRKIDIESDEKDKDKYYKSAIFVDTPVIEISGTEIRERRKNNLPIDFLVPQKVNEYICNLNLYK